MEIHIGKRIAEIELLSKEGNKVLLTIDGKEFEVDVVMTENGVCSILHNGRSYNAELIRSEMSKKYKVNTHFSSFDVEVIDTQAKYLRMRKKEEESQDDKISSPMPGKVVKILVAEGDQVKAGDTVLVIEAMKMQSNYKVNSDCTIKEILITEGDAVTSDQVLIKLDLTKEA
ncbi:MAG: biotin/lipoyl-containing protein [Bacteroidales bacterium]